jgi:alpha 1,2-mannosyltransferase
MKFFEYLDKAGGFYYERWGDAPVHSIGAALFAKKEQIHWFEDIGYKHEPFQVSLFISGKKGADGF